MSTVDPRHTGNGPAVGVIGPEAPGALPEQRWAELTVSFSRKLEDILDGSGLLQRTPQTEEAARRHFAALYRQAGLSLPCQSQMRPYPQSREK